MGHQQLYWSHPRKFGQGSRSCRVCSNRHGLIRKYGLNMCRQCFRQYAKDIGFVKAALDQEVKTRCGLLVLGKGGSSRSDFRALQSQLSFPSDVKTKAPSS
uniref:Small ribosomal subunit protein uS14 n=1 Tax=Equus asinus TaxID=9793 RepID=A0A9L0IXW5_EQUAS